MVCTKFGIVLLLLVLPEVVGWMINREYLDKTVIITLSLVVLIRSFVPGFFIVPVRLRTRFVASYFEAKR